MSDVIPISEAKANLSKLVKRARAGEVLYIGAYGAPEAMLAPLPARPRLAIGAWQERRVADFSYDDPDLIEPDAELADAFTQAVEKTQ